MIACFLTDLDVKEVGNSDNTWELKGIFRYYSAFLERTIEVPPGFITDFASVPRLPLAYLLVGDTAHKAAVIHDYLYQTHSVESRAVADRVLLEAMKATAVPAWRRLLIYGGVRIGGYWAWETGPARYDVLND